MPLNVDKKLYKRIFVRHEERRRTADFGQMFASLATASILRQSEQTSPTMISISRAFLLLLFAIPVMAQPPGAAPPAPATTVPPQIKQPAATAPSIRPPTVSNTERADVYKGLITTLHSGGEDKAALTQMQSLPPNIMRQLSLDPDFLATSAAVYSALGDNGYALRLLNNAEERYTLMRQAVPLGLQIQQCYLLLNLGDDAGLHSKLMFVSQIAERGETLTEPQRDALNNLWIYLTLRRATEETSAGNQRSALRILLTGYETYPDNMPIRRSLAAAYLNAGDAKTALQLYKEAGFSDASAAEFQAGIGAAFAAGDREDARKWLRMALQKSPADPRVLTLAAKVEQAAGHRKLAARYYREALLNMPKQARALTVPAKLRDGEGKPQNAPAAPPVTLAAMTDPASSARQGSDTMSSIGTLPTVEAHTYGNHYLPGERIAPVLVPIYVAQPSPAIPRVSAPSTASKPAASGGKRKLRNRDSTSDVPRESVLPALERLGEYDPSR